MYWCVHACMYVRWSKLLGYWDSRETCDFAEGLKGWWVARRERELWRAAISFEGTDEYDISTIFCHTNLRLVICEQNNASKSLLIILSNTQYMYEYVYVCIYVYLYIYIYIYLYIYIYTYMYVIIYIVCIYIYIYIYIHMYTHVSYT